MARSWATAIVLACLLIGPCPHAVAAASESDNDAVSRWTRAADAHRSRGETGAWAEALARRAEAYQRLGHRQQALADLERAAGLLAAAPPSPLHAATLGALGQAYLRAGRAVDAGRTLDQALTVAERVSASRIAAAVLNDQGSLLAVHGKADAALESFSRSATLAAKVPDRIGQGKALVNTARLQHKQGNRESAAHAAAAAVEAVRTEPDHADKAFVLIGAGALLRELGAAGSDVRLVTEAQQVLLQASAVAGQVSSPRAAAEAWGELAELALARNAITEAKALNERALFHAQAAALGETQFFAQWRAARLLHATGPAEDALAAYRRALSTLTRIKADLAAELWSVQDSFTQRIGPAYLGLADLLLQRAAASADATARREALREIQRTLESFRQIELEDYFRDDCVARYLARARGIEQISARTAVIYPVPLADRLELVVTIGEAIHQVTVPIGAEQLEQETRTLRSLLEKRTTYQYLPHARRLYDWILRPLESVLQAARVDTIVLIPDRPLRSIPLAALHDGSQFVMARYALATAPSLTLVEPTPLKTDAATVLASGLTQSVQGFAALPHVGSELDVLSRLRAGATLRDHTFTTANLEHELRTRPYSIVHIASHAQFEADSRRSFVLTYDGRLTIDRLEDQLKQNRFRDQPVELLFLSACQTAAGDERAALGLAGVAVKAGARSALATLWHINDQASSLLVGEFYRQLGERGVSKAEALRRAQLSLFNDLRYRHPGYWSPFLVIGNWL
jgi:CHAT domain-containing protein